jgi:hypothetical protein
MMNWRLATCVLTRATPVRPCTAHRAGYTPGQVLSAMCSTSGFAATAVVLGLGLGAACGGRTELLSADGGADAGSSSSGTADSGGGSACIKVALQCPSTADGMPTTTSCVGPAWAEWPMPEPEPAHIPTSDYVIDSVDGVVTDTVTGLVWQEPTPNNTLTWEGAGCYCASLTLAGHQDWRVPTLIELISLIDETIPPPGPNINGVAFPSTVGGGRGEDEMGYGYWTSTPEPGNAPAAWKVHFDFLYGNDATEDVTSAEHVRCVRQPEQKGAVSPKDHWNIQNGTVYDRFTALTWQEAIPSTGGDDGLGDFSWSNAESYCAQLALDGGGWRLPKVKELATLVDVTTEVPAIDSSAFPGTPGEGSGSAISDSFWTSTLVTGFTTGGLLVDFAYGVIGDDGVQYPYRVRCVR